MACKRKDSGSSYESTAGSGVPKKAQKGSLLAMHLAKDDGKDQSTGLSIKEYSSKLAFDPTNLLKHQGFPHLFLIVDVILHHWEHSFHDLSTHFIATELSQQSSLSHSLRFLI